MGRRTRPEQTNCATILKNDIILMANDASSPKPFVTFISSKPSHTILGQIVMDGKGNTVNATDGIEQCQWSPRTGKFYLNIPEVDGDGNNTKPGMVLVIDPVTKAIEQKWTIPLADCTGPQGMAIGPTNQILLGCNRNNKTLVGTGSVIIDEDPTLKTPKILHTLNGAWGNDQVWFNAGDDQYFLAGSNQAKLFVVDPNGDIDPDGIAANSPKSFSGSHSVAADPVQNQVYVPVNNWDGLCQHRKRFQLLHRRVHRHGHGRPINMRRTGCAGHIVGR